jgi:transcription antitermination factor NusG
MLLWYVIQTKPNKEGDTSAYLRDKGLEILSPLMENVSVKGSKMTRGLRPLFPSYIFARFDIDSSYALVRWARGAKKVLSFGGYPVPVSESAVELIKARTDTSGVVRKCHSFTANDVIRIKTGPLRDLLGIFEKWMPDHERVRVLLNLIGYQPTIELHCSMVEKVA